MIFTALSSLWTTRKWWGTAVLIFSLLAMIAGGWFYLSSQSWRIASLTSERDRAIIDLEDTRSANISLQKEVAHAKQTVTRLNHQMADARQQAEAYRRKFSGHDLSELAARHAGLITRRARDATERVLSDLESAINGNDPNDQPVSGSSADRQGDATTSSANRSCHRWPVMVRVRCGGLSQPGRESSGLLAGHTAATRGYRILPRMPPPLSQG